MIEPDEFAKLRLRSYLDDAVDLENWQYMGREWVGEADGLRPADDPCRLGSLAIDLEEVPSAIAARMLGTLGLGLRPHMGLAAVIEQLGEPFDSAAFVPDRRSHDFRAGDSGEYVISCTLKHDGGLIYIVVMNSDYREAV